MKSFAIWSILTIAIFSSQGSLSNVTRGDIQADEMWISTISTENASVLATWATFKVSHTIDYRVDKTLDCWDKIVWDCWLKFRNDEYLRLCPSCTPLIGKPINSVINDTDTNIVTTFRDKNTLPGYGTDYHWSRNLHTVIVFRPPKLFRCDKVYIAAKLDNLSKPIHFQGIYGTRPTSGTINYDYKNNCLDIL